MSDEKTPSDLANAIQTLAIVLEEGVNQMSLLRDDIHMLRLALETIQCDDKSELGTLDNPMIPLECVPGQR